jgi:hypothetical protein
VREHGSGGHEGREEHFSGWNVPVAEVNELDNLSGMISGLMGKLRVIPYDARSHDLIKKT